LPAKEKPKLSSRRLEDLTTRGESFASSRIALKASTT
jgi:hypothetical protein